MDVDACVFIGNRAGEIARSGGWGWHLGDEGSGFWIGERAIREVLRAADGRGPSTRLDRALSEHFEIERPEQILYAIYDREFPRTRVAKFAARVEEAAAAGDAVAKAILSDAAIELVRAASSVRDRLRLEEAPYDEANDARRVAQHLETDHTELYVSAADAMAVG